MIELNVDIPHFNPGEGEVYFVSVAVDDFPIKIGYAWNVSRRIRELQTPMPWPLTLLARMPGGRSRERDMKIGFMEYRMRGEWYERGERLMDHIAVWRARNERTIRRYEAGILPVWDVA